MFIKPFWFKLIEFVFGPKCHICMEERRPEDELCGRCEVVQIGQQPHVWSTMPLLDPYNRKLEHIIYYAAAHKEYRPVHIPEGKGPYGPLEIAVNEFRENPECWKHLKKPVALKMYLHYCEDEQIINQVYRKMMLM